MNPSPLTIAAFAAACSLLQAQSTLRVGVLATAPEHETSPDATAIRAMRMVADQRNAAGGVDGATIELVIEPCESKQAVGDAVDKLDESGVHAIVAPLDPTLAEATRKACRKKLACVSFAATQPGIVTMLNRLCEDHSLITRVALVHDQAREARQLAKLLESEEGLAFPTELVFDFTFRSKGKKFERELAEADPELLVVDGEPKHVVPFLTEWAARGIPTLLTPRSIDADVLAADVPTLVLLGQSPASHHSTRAFREAYEKQHGPLRFGAGEGFEAMTFVARAADAAGSLDRTAILAALDGITAEGARGRVTFDGKESSAAPPLGVWQLEKGTVAPYYPAEVSIATIEAGTKVETKPDPDLGEPFGTWRTRQFEFEEGTQWVWCYWGRPGQQTIDDDLGLLGLSTGGVHPIIDRIVKDELMARVIAITSQKFGRNADGTPVEGKSLKISFAAYKPKGRKKRRLWPAAFAGDDSAAGGRAFGTYCEIYTSFIRRTIFQPHALTPAIGPDDLTYIDGSYEFGTDHKRDKRSELIRALINGYAGAMALTTAHEVGHLAGLGHITHDPKGIMNVEEGAGLDYRDAYFTPESWAKMQAKLGLSGEDAPRRRRGN